MLMMPIAGILTSKLDPRWLIAVGFGMTALALHHITNLNLAIDFHTIVLWRMYQVMGMAFIFIPISTLSYVGVPPEKNNQVSGISNFVRNLGGSVGISMLTTFIARQSQVHQSNLVANATSANPQFRAMMNGAGGSGTNSAMQHSYNQIMGLIQQQATLLSYVNAFWIVSVLVACLIPLPFIMRRPRVGEVQAAGMH